MNDTTNQSLYSVEECEKIALEASLRYIKDNFPGIIRKKYGKGFAYFYPNGIKIKEKQELQRIQSLAIPPAYQDVWICPFANGHIQAVGRDNRHRKQYHYHPLWQEARQKQKFDMMLQFGESLPTIREHIYKILSQPPSLDKKQIICAILYLLDTACIRIGNSTYAQKNKTYGLTTLRKKHVSIHHDKAVLDFEGKNSKLWHVVVHNKKIVKLLKKCVEIPGYEIFKYQDEEGVINTISSQDINLYLKWLTNKPFTAKDFRTWIASRECLTRLVLNSESPDSEKELLKEVAMLLGHTPTICQKNYIHPDILSAWKEGDLEKWKNKNLLKIKNLTEDEVLLYWLKNKCC